jgi:predicted TIM-barrel fold metal-dependent hydrolase
VVLAMDGVIDSNGELATGETELYIPNAFVARECGRYPNLLFGASINPLRPDALERLQQAVSDGAVLMKWLPSIQHIDPAAERLRPFYRQLIALGLPLLTHTGWERSFTRARNELADPERLRLPLSLGVTVIAAHAGGGGKFHGEAGRERFLKLARHYPNLYADISALTQLNRLTHLPWLLRHPELHDRLCYGSDMPLVNTALVLAWGHLLRLSPGRILAINRIANPWDRDVALKEALGVTTGMLGNGAKLIRWSGKAGGA